MKASVRIGTLTLLLAASACQSRSVANAGAASAQIDLPAPSPTPTKPSSDGTIASSNANSTSPSVAPPSAPPPTNVASTSNPKLQQGKTRYRVAAVGDSLTDERVRGGKYLDVLRARCPNSHFDNYGIGGEMVNQMLRRFDRDVLSKRFEPGNTPYTHVIVFGGVNDLYSNLSAGRSNTKIERDLGAMYDAAHTAGIHVVAFTVAPWGGFTRYYNAERGQNTLALNAWIEAQATTKRVDQVIDAYRLLSCGDSERLCEEWTAPFNDGLHFGAPGHERLGLALFETAFSDCE